MPVRLKVLMSAYACEPGKGSEPEVGWQWALQMARFHDVTVVTRANNRPLIEPALAALNGKQPLPQFVYHDRGAHLLQLKQRFGATKLYYLLWQRSAREVIQQLHHVHRYDLMHHVTFAGFRYPTAVWGHGAPAIWGPIGGIESIPRALLPWHHFRSLVHEASRNVNNLHQAAPFHVLPHRARATTLILTSTREMQRSFARFGFQAQLMPTIGLRTREIPYAPPGPSNGPLRLLFVGNIITLKGVDLALEALKQSGLNATFTLVGDGDYLPSAREQAARLGLQQQVRFLGRLPREQVLKLFGEYDTFLFPSLHDTGGYAVIEAMFNEVPIICLDCGGPAVAVQEGCGLKVPLGKRTAVIDGLARALQFYDQDRTLLRQHGRAARAAILSNYDWDRKGEQMNECYQSTVRQADTSRKHCARRPYSGIGGLTNLLHQMFSFRGVLASLLALLVIGALGFVSLSHLKTQANAIVSDTLPGLSYAGEANATLGQAFNQTLMLLMTDNPEECTRLRHKIESYSRLTSSSLSTYKEQIYTDEDRMLYDQLLKCRLEYLAIRSRVLDLAEHGQRTQALAVCQTELFPAYQAYKQAGDHLFKYNMRQGQARSHTIMNVCTVTQFVVASIGILVFIMGFFIGMFR